MANVDPQILNLLRAQQDVGSPSIEHVHVDLPAQEVVADPPPEGIVERMVHTARVADMFRAARLRRAKETPPKGDA